MHKQFSEFSFRRDFMVAHRTHSSQKDQQQSEITAASQCGHCGAEHTQSQQAMRYRRQHKKHYASWVFSSGFQQLLLLAFIVMFLSFNYGFFQEYKQGNSMLRAGGVRRREQWISDAAQPFNQHGVAAETRHLIVVAGHSVTISGHLEDADEDEHDWFLLDYQKHHG
jgi:hypothetical protein